MFYPVSAEINFIRRNKILRKVIEHLFRNTNHSYN